MSSAGRVARLSLESIDFHRRAVGIAEKAVIRAAYRRYPDGTNGSRFGENRHRFPRTCGLARSRWAVLQNSAGQLMPSRSASLRAQRILLRQLPGTY